MLRQYERALRRRRLGQVALREIVAPAFNLDRRAEVARYAQRVVPHDAEDAVLLRRLGIELAEEGDWDAGASKLYEKVAAVQPGQKPSASAVMWWMEMGRLYHLTRQYDAAARQFSRVSEALAHPEKFGLSETLRLAVLGTGELTYQLFGECFLEAGQTAQAQAAFEKSDVPERAIHRSWPTTWPAWRPPKSSRPRCWNGWNPISKAIIRGRDPALSVVGHRAVKDLARQDQLLPQLEQLR